MTDIVALMDERKRLDRRMYRIEGRMLRVGRAIDKLPSGALKDKANGVYVRLHDNHWRPCIRRIDDIIAELRRFEQDALTRD